MEYYLWGKRCGGTLAAALGLILLWGLALSVSNASAASRSFELVSPPDSGAYDVAKISISGFDLFLGSEADGSRIYWGTGGDFPGIPNHGSARTLVMSSSRGPDAWGTSWMAPYCPGVPNLNVPGAKCTGAISRGGDDLRTLGVLDGRAVVMNLVSGDPWPFGVDIDPADRNRGHDVYSCDAQGGCFLLSGKTTGGTEAGAAAARDTNPEPAVSKDLSTVVWATQATLDPTNDTDGGMIDFYANYKGETVLVSSKTGGAGTSDGGSASGFSSHVTSPNPLVTHTVSDNGEHVHFVTPKQLDDAHPGIAGLYSRNMATKTVKLLSPQGTLEGCEGTLSTSIQNNLRTGAVAFEWAAQNGSRVYFRTIRRYFEDHCVAGEAPNRFRLYAADPDGGNLTLVSEGAGANADLVTLSPDGKRALFRTTAVIPGAGVPAEVPAAAVKLYLWDDAAEKTVFVADLTGEATNRLGSILRQNPGERTIRSTDDGSVFVLSTTAPLSEGDDNSVADVYRIDVGVNDEIDISLLSSGAPGAAPAELGPPAGAAGSPQVATSPILANRRFITDDASRVYFTSTDVLSEGAAENGNLKIYEHEWGRGIELVSPPGDAAAVHFLDNSADGTDVFFLSDESIWPTDTDEGMYDIYNARLAEAEPPPFATPEVIVPEPCRGDSCQGPNGLVPGELAIGTTGARGDGNVIEPKPTRVKVRLRLKPRVSGTAVSVIVRASERGRVRLAGAAIRSRAVRVKARSNRTVRVALSRKVRRKLARSGRMKIRVRALWRGADGVAARGRTARVVRKVK